MPEYLLFMVKETLTDGSEVYNVIFGDFKFAAVSVTDAVQLADKIMDAINEHTTQTAVVDELW
jgi:hypothetical protein